MLNRLPRTLIATPDKVDAVKIDLSLTKMKPLGAKWLVKLYDHLSCFLI